ncbi:MAG: Gldg family protein [Chitinophagaceae bacterium]|nr:Gldg family protein [Chitinophagaceae bacterium]
MRNILKFTRTAFLVQLHTPVSWLVVLVFLVQTGVIFCDSMDQFVRNQLLKYGTADISFQLFSSSSNGLFVKVQSYLYLYVPLLTMGIFSREFSTGSIKLLYSSPVSNFTIVLSKFLSLVLIGLVLIGILLIYVVIAILVIDVPDTAAIFSGLLGLFLLLVSYIAIGMFMSSLTSYSVVAALGTLIVFAVLNFAGTLWQDVPVVQDICYWLVLKGRADTFINGMITTEDLLYFIFVPAMFLAFTYCGLQAHTNNRPLFQKILRYSGVFLITALVGFISSRPSVKKYFDLTETKRNTLSQASLKVLSGLDKKVTIHTYVNMLYQGFLVLPVAYKTDEKRFEQYLRFKPETELKYHYYSKLPENSVYRSRYPKLSENDIYDTLKLINDWNVKLKPVAELPHLEILEQEDYAFLRVLEYEDGSTAVVRTFKDLIRLPKELEISTGFMGLYEKPARISVYQKNGERSLYTERGDGIGTALSEKTSRTALVNLGFSCDEIDPYLPIPETTDILLIADPTVPYTDQTLEYIDEFFARGGHVMVLTESKQSSWMNEWLSKYTVTIGSEILLQQNPKLKDEELIVYTAGPQEEMGPYYQSMGAAGLGVITPGAAEIRIDSASPFEVKKLLQHTDTTGTVHTTAVAITLPGKPDGPKMLVMSDADWLTNEEINKQRNGVRAVNALMLKATMGWLSNNHYPINIERPIPSDRKLNIQSGTWKKVQAGILYILPLLLAGAFVWIFVRRNRV